MRYQVSHQVGEELYPFGEADELTAANQMILFALHGGAAYACQHDTTPELDRAPIGPKLLVDAHANLVGA